MGKYEELDSLQKLKESGSITEKEFEVEKYKILNNTNNSNNSKTEGIYIASLVLGICSFLFCGIPILGLILSISRICIKYNWFNSINTYICFWIFKYNSIHL